MPCASDLSRIQSSHSRKKTANSYGGRAILQGTRQGPTETLKIMKNKAGWLISLIGLRKATNISEAHFWVCLWWNFWRILTEVGTPMPCAGRGFRLTQKEKVSRTPSSHPFLLLTVAVMRPAASCPCHVTSLQGWTVPTQTTSPDRPNVLKGLLLGVLSHP